MHTRRKEGRRWTAHCAEHVSSHPRHLAKSAVRPAEISFDSPSAIPRAERLRKFDERLSQLAQHLRRVVVPGARRIRVCELPVDSSFLVADGNHYFGAARPRTDVSEFTGPFGGGATRKSSSRLESAIPCRTLLPAEVGNCFAAARIRPVDCERGYERAFSRTSLLSRKQRKFMNNRCFIDRSLIGLDSNGADRSTRDTTTSGTSCAD